MRVFFKFLLLYSLSLFSKGPNLSLCHLLTGLGQWFKDHLAASDCAVSLPLELFKSLPKCLKANGQLVWECLLFLLSLSDWMKREREKRRREIMSSIYYFPVSKSLSTQTCLLPSPSSQYFLHFLVEMNVFCRGNRALNTTVTGYWFASRGWDWSRKICRITV